MRIPINLASQPYENVRPLYVGVALASALFVVFSVALAWSIRSSRSETRLLTEQSAKLDRETATLNGEQGDLTKWLARPEVQDIRSQSDYLNSMIVRKSLSWTQIFMDLEKVLPNQVQVTTIHPGLTADKQPELNLSVSALTLPPLVEFLKNLESSTRFDKPVVASQRFPAEKASDPFISLDLQVDYRPSGEEQAALVNNNEETLTTTPAVTAKTLVPAAAIAEAAKSEPSKNVVPVSKETAASQPMPMEQSSAGAAALPPAHRVPGRSGQSRNTSPEAAKEER